MTDTPDHQSRAHASLGASSAHRWMTCPGSIRLSQDMPNRSSKYADEGTAAHQVAEKCLSIMAKAPYVDDRAAGDWAAAQFIGTVEHVNGADWPVTEEMAEAVQLFVDVVQAQFANPEDELLAETRFDLSRLHPNMFGTNDAAVLSRKRGTLFVNDYKHGKGHAVEAVGNPQLRYYGLGALMTLGAQGIHTVVLTIVQPRARHADGAVRQETISVMDLMEWAGDLIAAARATHAPDAPIVAGDHCTFCPAAGVCPALRDKALKSASADFDGYVVKVPADPKGLDAAELAALLDGADLVDGWISAVRAHAQHLAEAGVPIPSYKLVDKRPTRRWVDPSQVAQALSALGVPTSDLYHDPELKSVAQMETVLPKELGKNKELRGEKIRDLWEAKSSGRNLVKDTDSRPSRSPSVLADFVGYV